MSAAVARLNVSREAIIVVCRIRPLNQAERLKSTATCLTYPSNNAVAIAGKNFTFDVVLGPAATQSEVYESTAKQIILSVLNGYNGTIFAYGQTASGKTYTMEGKIKDAEHKGLIPRIIEDIFLHIDKMDENLEFLIKGVTERFVSCADDVLDALDEGKMNRHVSVTNMNEHSSRSHSIFRICIQQNNRETGTQLIGSLYLVDLAGSEKVSRSGAEGSTLEEAKHINRSLSTLGNVINALVEGNTHIPYRDSKLTRILQQSLGGNSKTTILIAASPASTNELETKSTMIFGVRAKTIKNQVAPNAQLTAEEWRRLYERETDRNSQIRHIFNAIEAEVQRWRNGETLTEDEWFTEDSYGKQMKELGSESCDISRASLCVNVSRCPPSTGNGYGTSAPGDGIRPEIFKGLPSVPMESSEESHSGDLFRLLDEKDDEINQQCQLIGKLQGQVTQTKEEYTRIREENDRLQVEVDKAQHDAEVRRAEVKDVLQALEELAMTYDERNTECKNMIKEMEMTNTELGHLKEKQDSCKTEMEDVKLRSISMREKLRDLIYGLNVEMAELSIRLNGVYGRSRPEKSQCVEEQAAMLKLLVIQIRSEVKPMLENRYLTAGRLSPIGINPNVGSPNARKNASGSELQRDMERKLTELHQMLTEADAVIKRKNELAQRFEEELRLSEKQVLQQRAQKQLLQELKQTNGMNEATLERFQTSIERASSYTQEQLMKARGETESALDSVDKLKSENVILKLQLERYIHESELMSQRLDSVQLHGDCDATRQVATNELRGMEEAVMQELGVLHSLRRAFITDLKQRIRKNFPKDVVQPEEEPIDSQTLGTAVQRERILFLKNSLDNLTKIHKQLVRDNADLRCDIPKLEKRVEASVERIKDLEVALRDSKEKMIRDKRRYHQELERIKEANWVRGCARPRTNIVKPIRAGQQKESA